MWKAVKVPLQLLDLGVIWLSLNTSILHFGAYQTEHFLCLRTLLCIAVLITIKSRIRAIAQELQSNVSG